jgi:hypothetical protein
VNTPNVAIDELLQRLVGSLVRETALLMESQSENTMAEIEAHLYRVVSKRCAERAEIAAAFAEDAKEAKEAKEVKEVKDEKGTPLS